MAEVLDKVINHPPATLKGGAILLIILLTLLSPINKSLASSNLFTQKIKSEKIEGFFDNFEKLVFALADDPFAIDWKSLENKSKDLNEKVFKESQEDLSLSNFADLSQVLYKFTQAGNFFYEQDQDPEISAQLIRESLQELRQIKTPNLRTRDEWGREKVRSLKEAISNLDNLIDANLQYLEENLGV